MRRLAAALCTLAFALAGCTVTTLPAPGPVGPGGPAPGTARPAPAPAPRVAPVTQARLQSAARQFVQVVEDVTPVAERECRRRAPAANCDFRIVIDDRPGQPANAFQTLSSSGQPLIAFTPALIVEADNADELAFVLGHEAAHHIAGHIARQRQNATAGAVILGGLATLTGGTPDTVRTAERFGATVGARRYSKDYELEADALGTIIAARAGYDPVRGALFFARIPDPGDRFLGTHPPNADRMDTVRRTAASLRR